MLLWCCPVLSGAGQPNPRLLMKWNKLVEILEKTKDNAKTLKHGKIVVGILFIWTRIGLEHRAIASILGFYTNNAYV